MKFSTIDKKYLDARRELSEAGGPRELWSVIDQWPLYVGVANLARFMAIADLLRSTLDVPGHVAEFGSWRGANLLFMAKLLKIYDPHGCKQVHCFESFEGLTTIQSEDGSAKEMAGTYRGSYDELMDMIALVDLNDDIVINKGLIQDTLIPLLEQQPGMTFSFVYCDTDLYEPTKIILDSLDERLATGGVFVLDQWNDERWPGEATAVNEFVRKRGDAYRMEHVRSARQPTLVLRKIKAS